MMIWYFSLNILLVVFLLAQYNTATGAGWTRVYNDDVKRNHFEI